MNNGRRKPYDTVLLDLDDTLLHNPMDRFMPAYFDLLVDYVRPIMPDRYEFLALLMRSTQAAVANVDPALTIRDVFWSHFSEQTDLDATETENYIAGFYRDVFPKLRPVTAPKAEAVPLIQDCLARGIQVVIATNPLFPRAAIENRLAWAGLPVETYPFALVTTYENMHAAKPQSAYYEEILARLGATPQRAVMVGDEWHNDILPARRLGLDTFWIADPEATPPEPELVTGWGTLADFHGFLNRIGIQVGIAV